MSPEIVNLEKLIALVLNNNQLKELPKYLGELKELKIIEIDNNQFTEFPEVLLKIPTLTKISIKGNKIKNPEKYEKLLTERGIEYIY